MSHRQIIISVVLTILSLVAGYYLNVLANRESNKMFLKNLREELDIIDNHYERLIAQGKDLDPSTKKYLELKRDLLNARITSIEKMYQ